MFGNTSYHQIVRKTIIAFGTLFNNIYIHHQDENTEEVSVIKVPIRYGPIQKFLARLEEKPDLRKRQAITLPRLSYEIGKMTYDSSRKTSKMQTFNAVTAGGMPAKLYMPVPYNLPIELSIITKFNDDMFEIIEQILPYFTPELNVTIDLIKEIGEKRDVPIVLNDVSPFQDNYEGNYETRRNLICTLSFTAKIYFFGPIPSDNNSNVIKKVQVDYHTGTNVKNSSRQLRYIATPRAIKDYNNDQTTTLAENISEKQLSFDVSDATSLVPNTYISIGNEEMLIKDISNNTLIVARGADGTEVSTHNEGDVINAITTADDDLVLPTDDYEFNEETFDFDDGKIYSPRKGIDV